jgi:hypothetical protein
MSGGGCTTCSYREYLFRDGKRGMKIFGGGDLIEEGIMVRHPFSLGRIEALLLRGGLGFNLIFGVLMLLCPFCMLLLFE